VGAWLLALVLNVAGPLPSPGGPFDYDATAPLDVRESAVERRGSIAVHEISYASPKGGRVPATLVVPDGAGPFAAVIWGHWYWEYSEFRNRREFLAEAVALTPSGVVSLLTDGPVARPGHVADPTPLNARQMADLVQQVVDMRRGADLLLARKDVDPRRLGYVGHSYNASVGGILSGVDRRFAVFVLMAGGLSDEADRRLPVYRRYREKVGPARFDAYVAAYSWADPGAYVSRAAPAFVFLQYATEEDFLSPEHVREYVALVSDPKRFALYEAPHALNADARRDRIAFLCEQLCVPPPSSAAVAAVPELPQPPAAR
jgi:dienelactone hydrolase